MKTFYLLLSATLILVFQSCQTENLDAYAPHFHAEAFRSGLSVTAEIKAPDRFGQDIIYVSAIEPINEVRTSLKEREEMVLAAFSFSTNKEDKLASTAGKGYVWDAECGTLTITGNVGPRIKFASILVNVPDGIKKVYEHTEKHEAFEKGCYEKFKTTSLSGPKATQFSFIYLHPGHPTMDPEFGKDGIPIKEGN